jgi:tetratricopeptide (TPR) repeat protein
MIRDVKYILTILFFSLIAAPLADIQAQQVDSIFTAISNKPDSDEKIFLWINAANEISESDPSNAVDYIEEALKLSLKLDNIRGEAYCYNSLGGLNFTLGKFKKSVKHYKNALTLFEGFEDSEIGYYSALKNIGASYEKLEDFETALDFYNQFLDVATQKNNEDDIVFATNGLARCNQELENYNDSEIYYQQAYTFEQKRNNPVGLVNASNNLGNFYEAVNDSVSAFNYFDTSLVVAQNASLTDATIPTITANGTQDFAVQATNTYFVNADNYYSNRGMIDEQIQVNQEAMEFNEVNGNPELVNKANLNLGKLNLQKNNSKEAIEYLRNSIDLSDELGQLEAKGEALEAITEAYKEEGDYEQALISFQELVALQDSIQKEKNKQSLLANNLSIELEQKEDQIELMLENDALKEEAYALDIEKREAENQNKLYIIYALIGILLIMTIAAVLIIRSNKERAKTNMLLELKSLRTQMNPHFIFNSLNSVNSFISKNDDRSANKYLSRFSQLMRLVLENSKHDFVPLESELKIIELYMELEHLRFQDKFDYDLNIASSINVESIEIPPMLVQPYIENAVWHGLRYLDEKGHLDVKVKQDENSLTWTITDNGIGRKASAEMKTKNQKLGESTGMKNIEQRLGILNKMHATQMKTTIIDLEEGGTQVILEIPIKK